MKNVKGVNIKTSIRGLFDKWLQITTPFHKLTKTEQKVLAGLLYYHYIYKRTTKSEIVIWKMVFDYDTKLKIKKELDMTDSMLQNTFSKLRKKNIIKDNRIISTYIPDLSNNSINFKVIYNFIITDNDKR